MFSFGAGSPSSAAAVEGGASECARASDKSFHALQPTGREPVAFAADGAGAAAARPATPPEAPGKGGAFPREVHKPLMSVDVFPLFRPVMLSNRSRRALRSSLCVPADKHFCLDSSGPTEDVIVPVLQSLHVKRFEQDERGNIVLVGTLIQRVLCIDPRAPLPSRGADVDVSLTDDFEDETDDQPCFRIRLSRQRLDGTASYCNVRKRFTADLRLPSEGDDDDDDDDDYDDCDDDDDDDNEDEDVDEDEKMHKPEEPDGAVDVANEDLESRENGSEAKTEPAAGGSEEAAGGGEPSRRIVREFAEMPAHRRHCKVEVCNVRFVCTRTPVFERFPFSIVCVEAMIELESFSRRIPCEQHDSGARAGVVHFRPSLIMDVTDDDTPSRLVTMDEEIDRIDNMQDYDIVLPIPCYRLIEEFKTVQRPKAGRGRRRHKARLSKPLVYVPKLQVRFFMEPGVSRAWIQLILPLGLALASSISNIVMVPIADKADFIGNNITIGLTLIFLLPHMAESISIRNKVTNNQWLVIGFLVGLIITNLSAMEQLAYGDEESRRIIGFTVNILLLAVLIAYVTYSYVIYRRKRFAICRKLHGLKAATSTKRSKGTLSAAQPLRLEEFTEYCRLRDDWYDVAEARRATAQTAQVRNSTPPERYDSLLQRSRERPLAKQGRRSSGQRRSFRDIMNTVLQIEVKNSESPETEQNPFVAYYGGDRAQGETWFDLEEI